MELGPYLSLHDEPPKQTWTPCPPMAAVKQWNPHDSSSAVTLSTTVADSTDTEWLREIMVYNIIIQDG